MRRPRVLVVLYAVVLLGFLWPRVGVEPYDDSYFFKRVAVNLLARGRLAWNVDEGPVYGLTSQTFQVLTVAVAALARDHYVLAIRGVLAFCLLATCLLLVRLTREWDFGLSALYTLCSPVVLYMVLSGMETAFALAVLSAYLGTVHGRNAKVRPFWVAPLLAVLACVTRPDTAVLVVPTLLVERYRARRELPWREAVVLVVGVSCALALFRFCYGTCLPLPFYAKTSFFSPYDPHFVELSNQVQHYRFGLVVAVALPLVWLAVRRFDPTNLTLLASVLVYEAYLYATTVEVMGMQGRFYAPALPFLCIASARGAEVRCPKRDRASVVLAAVLLYALCIRALGRAHWLPRADDWWMDTVDPWFLGATLCAGGILVACGAWRRFRQPAVFAVTAASIAAAAGSTSAGPLEALDDDAYLVRHAWHVTTYRGMDALRHCVGDAIHVYHSEVGVTGLRFQAGKVTDLAGLWSPRWLFRKPGSFDEFCEAERPEAIFLPHRNYERLNREILGGNCIRRYRRVVQQSSSPLYVRADLVSRYLSCPEANEWR